MIQILHSLQDFDGTTQAQFYAWVSKIVENIVPQQERYFDAKKRRMPSSDSKRQELIDALGGSNRTPSAEISNLEEMELLTRARGAGDRAGEGGEGPITVRRRGEVGPPRSAESGMVLTRNRYAERRVVPAACGAGDGHVSIGGFTPRP